MATLGATPSTTDTSTFGGLVLLAQLTAASSATLNFTTCFTSAYDEYQIEIVNAVPSADADLLMLVSSDAGSTWASSNYRYAMRYINTTPTAGNQTSGAASSFNLFTAEATSSAGVVATIKLFSPLNASVEKLLTVLGMSHNSDGLFYSFFGGMVYNSSSAVNAVQFKYSTGTIVSGTVRVYGVAK